MPDAALAPTPLRPDHAAFDAEVAAYLESVEARRLSPRTVKAYRDALAVFRRFLVDTGRGLDPASISRRDCQAYLAHLTRTYKPSSAKGWWIALGTFYKWEVAEAAAVGDVLRSPLEGISAPRLPSVRVPVVASDDVDRLLDACRGTAFEDLRDRALIALMVSTGLRRQEVADLLVEDVAGGVVRVAVGKGERERVAAYGAVAAEALRRYLKVRPRHRDANLEATVGARTAHARRGRPLFLCEPGAGHTGRLGGSGITAVIDRRGRAAGLGHLRPHQLRHTYAHAMLALGVPEGAVMQMGGWRTRSMLDRYGADLAQERALTAYKDPLARADRQGR